MHIKEPLVLEPEYEIDEVVESSDFERNAPHGHTPELHDGSEGGED